jgi:hypothetical protein
MMEARDDNRTLYWTIGIIAVVLCVIGLLTYSGQKDTKQAQAKAQELTQKFKAAGLEVPVNDDVFVRTLGSDGGTVCENPATALGRATLIDSLFNGASFVGRRPVIVDEKVIKGEALILETYCPDKLQEYKDKFDDLKTDDTLKD